MAQLIDNNQKLYRSKNQRMIAGICGGLANYFRTDPSWIRLLFIILFFLGGSAILIYFIMWVVVPNEP